MVNAWTWWLLLGTAAAAVLAFLLAAAFRRHSRAVGKHCTSIFAKLDLAPSDDDNRRVLAVLAYLNT